MAALEAPYSDLEADMLSLGPKAEELARSQRAPRPQKPQKPQQPPRMQSPTRCVRRSHRVRSLALSELRRQVAVEQAGEQSKRAYRTGKAKTRDAGTPASSEAASRKL
jgi:hypothetical protein